MFIIKMLKNVLFQRRRKTWSALTPVPLLCLGQASKEVKPGLENITLSDKFLFIYWSIATQSCPCVWQRGNTSLSRFSRHPS